MHLAKGKWGAGGCRMQSVLGVQSAECNWGGGCRL